MLTKKFALLLLVIAAFPSLGAVRLKPIITRGLVNPLFVGVAPGEPDSRLYVIEQRGKIRIVENGKLKPQAFLDIEDRVTSGGEMGLLGLAFHPQYEQNGRYYINYTAQSEQLHTIVSEVRRGTGRESELLRFEQPYTNHNGGCVTFGPDGFLYIASGDGGSANDPHGNGQRLDTLLGKILRIDVNAGAPYAVPRDNPFSTGGGRGEIFAYGLRNPWRFSFDRANGLLYAADVGQNRYEEIDIVEKGKNYGWNTMEGKHCFHPETGCDQTGLVLPIHEYRRSEGVSITGGYVYRGQAIPELQGVYIYGDFGTGKIWGLHYDPETKRVLSNKLLISSGLPISSFGEDHAGEIYVVSHRGGIYRIEPVVKSTK